MRILGSTAKWRRPRPPSFAIVVSGASPTSCPTFPCHITRAVLFLHLTLTFPPQKVYSSTMIPAIEQPALHTPADEWAKETSDALQPAPSSRENTKVVPPAVMGGSSVSSTPGGELPGAFPRDALQEMADDSPYKIQETFNQGVEAARQYFPSQQTVQGYVPAQEDLQRAVGNVTQTARTYIPDSVVNAVEAILRSSFQFKYPCDLKLIGDPLLSHSCRCKDCQHDNPSARFSERHNWHRETRV